MTTDNTRPDTSRGKPGRPPTENPAYNKIAISLTDDELRDLVTIAESEGLPKSTLAARCVREYIQAW